MQQMLLILARLMKRTLKALRYPTLSAGGWHWGCCALLSMCVCVTFLCFRALDVQGIPSGWENQSMLVPPELELDLEPESEPELDLEPELELEPEVEPEPD